jgi:hypothetical protein
MEFVDMIRALGIFKTRWLLNIYFFGEWSIEKCTLDIHLIELEVMMGSEASRNRIASSLATGAYVSPKSSPST